MRLFIAEKPSLGRAIADTIGIKKSHQGYIECKNGDIVTWCIGHLLEQAEPEHYDDALKSWSLDTLPIIPKEWVYIAKEETKDQLNIVLDWIDKSDLIVNAGDPDREGAYLVNEVLEFANIPKEKWDSAERILINDLNPKAIEDALENIEPNSKHISVSDAAKCRSRADWLIDPTFATLKSTNGKALQALLNQSEALREPVLRKASELNRQQQKVKSLSHAINLIGEQQLVPVLAEADLNNKLSQLHHPQHQLLCQLADCISNSLQLLDSARLSPAQNRVLAYCLVAPLWFSSNGYLSAAGGKDMPTVLADFHSLNQAANRKWQDALLVHYQLSALTAIPDILFPQKPSELVKQRYALTLQIAVLSAAAIYNDHHHSLLNKALSLLNVASDTRLTADQHLADIASRSHSFCPLLLSL